MREPLCRTVILYFIACPELPDLTDGQLSNDAVSLGTETSVTCNVNFTLFGAANLRCTDDATWSSPFPDCKKGRFNTAREVYIIAILFKGLIHFKGRQLCKLFCFLLKRDLKTNHQTCVLAKIPMSQRIPSYPKYVQLIF